MTLPCLLIAPQIDLQAFIKLGRAEAFGGQWCIYVYVSVAV